MGTVPIRLDADNPDEVESGVRPATSTFVAAAVSGPDDANQLMIFSGTAIIAFEITDADQNTGIPEVREVDIILEKNLANADDFRGSATYVTLASLSVDDIDDQASYEFAITSGKTIVRPDGALRLIATISVRFDALLLRMSYQSFVLVRAT